MPEKKKITSREKLLVFLLVLSLAITIILGYLVFQINAHNKELIREFKDLSEKLNYYQSQVSYYKSEIKKLSRVLNLSF